MWFYSGYMPRVTDRYIERRRAEILNAAWRCFARDGFHAATMNDIIAEAGISPSVMYRWFRSKDELVAAAATEVLQGMIDALDEISAMDPPPSLTEAIEHVLNVNIVKSNIAGVNLPALAVQVWSESLREPKIHELVASRYRQLRDGLVELVRYHQGSGAFPAGLDAEELAGPLFSIFPGFILQELLLGAQDPHVYARFASSILQAWERESSDGSDDHAMPQLVGP